MIYFAYAMAWVSTAIATSIGIYFTGSAWCLWAMILPACISLKSSKKDDEDNG